MMINYNEKNRDLTAECTQKMSEDGLPMPEPMIADGKIHRWSADHKKNERDEWYVAHEGVSEKGNRYLICKYGSWSTGEKYEYKSYIQSESLDFHDRKALQALLKKKRDEAEAQLAITQNSAAKEAEKIWQESDDIPPSDEHCGYGVLKKIAPKNVKFGPNPNGYPSMIIDLRNLEGEIRSLQYISVAEDGTSYKRFLSGGEKKGNFHIIGAIVDGARIYVAEGYATAASVNQVTDAATVVAFDAGNLEAVANNIHSKFPNSPIIIAADNDKPGREKAIQAARSIGCKVAFPAFPEHKSRDPNGKPFKDFNDLHQVCEPTEIKNQLEKAIAVPNAQVELKKLAHALIQKNDPCEYFNLADLPDPLRNYITSLCETTGAHPIMIASSVLGTVSAFLGTKVFIPKSSYFQKLYPNLWILSIAKSGQFKTTALNAGAEISLEKQSQIFRARKQLEYDLQNEEDAARQNELKQAMLDLSLKNVLLPTRMTAEAFLKHIAQGHKGVILASEFGAWLQNLAKTYNSDLKGILMDIFDVPENWRNLTKNQGDDIMEEPYLSICGVATQAWINENIRINDVATGFFARFLIFTPPPSEEVPAGLPMPLQISRKLAKEEFECVLSDILDAIGEERSFTLSHEAQLFFNNKMDNRGLHQKIYLLAKSDNEKVTEILAPYTKRWSPYLLKVAMIMQLFHDPESKEIGVDALVSALTILIPAISSTAALFEGELGESEHQRKCRMLFDWILQKAKESGSVRRQDILSSKKLAGGVKEYDYILQTLIEQGKILYDEKTPKSHSLYTPIQTS